jgi:hypothetical protein
MKGNERYLLMASGAPRLDPGTAGALLALLNGAASAIRQHRRCTNAEPQRANAGNTRTIISKTISPG